MRGAEDQAAAKSNQGGGVERERQALRGRPEKGGDLRIKEVLTEEPGV